MSRLKPTVGSWYRDCEQGSCFEVVAVDDNDQTIEIQLLDGELAEYDQESWEELILEAIEEPEDWRNGYELSQEDGLDPDQPYHPDDGAPLDQIEPDIINGLVDE